MKTKIDFDARLREIQNYVNRYQFILGPHLKLDAAITHKIDAIVAADDDNHWDAACDLAEDLFSYYSSIVRKEVVKNG